MESMDTKTSKPRNTSELRAVPDASLSYTWSLK